ncbi:MAG: cell division protein ZipA C-terminal FtsZ-binding domain-containing protein [Panacagrimonas sp.]
MGELQWALLIVCAVLVVALYVFSRRSKRTDRESGDFEAPGDPASQMDLLTRPDPAFDEFGVGRARARNSPLASDPGASRPMTAAPPAQPSVAALLKPPSVGPGAGATGFAAPNEPRSPPSLVSGRAAASATVASPPATTTARRAAASPSSPTKLVALLVAPVEEIDIGGVQLHDALRAQGLKFGAGELYHRLIGGQVVYSVASLIRPGKLVPSQAETFSTKGLTVILNLPGPVSAAIAFDDMVATTRALATALKSEIFDTRRERLSDELATTLRNEVREWALASSAAAAESRD